MGRAMNLVLMTAKVQPCDGPPTEILKLWSNFKISGTVDCAISLHYFSFDQVITRCAGVDIQ